MKRNTIQRALTLKAVKELHCHATAEEIYNSVVSEYPSISRATVYRNLNDLAESGEIRRVEVSGSAEHFDHLCQDHYHVRCVKCEKIFDVDMAYMGDLTKAIEDSHGFTFSGYELMFKGICPECRNKELPDGSAKYNK